MERLSRKPKFYFSGLQSDLQCSLFRTKAESEEGLTPSLASWNLEGQISENKVITFTAWELVFHLLFSHIATSYWFIILAWDAYVGFTYCGTYVQKECDPGTCQLGINRSNNGVMLSNNDQLHIVWKELYENRAGKSNNMDLSSRIRASIQKSLANASTDAVILY